MAKISELPNPSTLTGGELLPAVQGTTNVKVPASFLPLPVVYNAGWPSRPNVSSSMTVLWIKFNASDPDPSIGGNGMGPVDVALLAQE
jgi:hypothetical protein